jgi:addiction module RelE/StbE family toxin
MGFKIVFTNPAIADLKTITEYIARNNPVAAEKHGFELIAKTEPLAQFPFLGRSVPEFKIAEIREVIHGSYRIVYRVREDIQAIEILRVWHAARGAPQLPKTD